MEKSLACNPGTDRSDLMERLRWASKQARAGVRCQCGNPIWVIGSAEVELSCFTCLTGEAQPSEDYELEDAIEVHARFQERLARRLERR